MSKSTITLYKSELIFGQNWKIDNIATYLSSLFKSDEIQGRYIPCRLNNTAVIKVPQSDIPTFSYNYCKVVNEGESYSYYYHIIAIEWCSKNSIKLTLRLDALNTFHGSYEELFDARTMMIRSHEDRYYSNGVRKVDPYNEGIDVIKDCRTLKRYISNNSMFLVQLSANTTTPNLTDTHPVKTLITYSTTEQWESGGSGTSIAYIAGTGNINTVIEGTITMNGTSYIIGTTIGTFNGTTGILRAVRCHYDSSTKYTFAQLLYYTNDKFPYSYLGKTDITVTSGIVTVTNCRRRYYENYESAVWNNMFNMNRIPLLSYDTINAGSYSAHYLTGMDKLDRTNSSIIQITVAPLISYTTSNSTFIEGYNMLIPNNSISTTFDTIPIEESKKTVSPSAKNTYDYSNESKLYSNQFMDIVISYQGQSIFNADLSQLNGNAQLTVAINMSIDDDNPQLIRFYINATNYSYVNIYDLYSYITSQYSVTLFTNEWNEYVRNGYNYDVAERNRNKSIQGWNIALGAIGTAVSVGATALTGGITAPIALSSINSLANSATALANSRDSYMNNAVAIMNNPDNLRKDGMLRAKAQSNYDQLINQSTQYSNQYDSANAQLTAMLSQNRTANAQLAGLIAHQGLASANSLISGINAIQSANRNYQQSLNSKAQSRSIISGYNSSYKLALDNNLMYEIYTPRPYVREAIAKIFYYTGYSHPVMEVPTEDSRYWFNYVQCNLFWADEAYEKFNGEILDDIARCYQEGVTVFHEHGGEYDLYQVYENWEVSLIGE